MGNILINLAENQLDYLVDKLQGLQWDVPKGSIFWQT